MNSQYLLNDADMLLGRWLQRDRELQQELDALERVRNAGSSVDRDLVTHNEYVSLQRRGQAIGEMREVLEELQSTMRNVRARILRNETAPEHYRPVQEEYDDMPPDPETVRKERPKRKVRIK